MNLLDEYVKISKTIERIDNYKELTLDKLKNAKSKREFEKHLSVYRSVMKKIKEDSELLYKYKQLKQRQQEIKNILLSSNDNKIINNLSNPNHSDDDIKKIIIDLQMKYSSKDKTNYRPNIFSN